MQYYGKITIGWSSLPLLSSPRPGVEGTVCVWVSVLRVCVCVSRALAGEKMPQDVGVSEKD